MLKMVDGTGIIGVDMVCPLGGTVSPPQPPNFDKVEMEGVGSLMLPNSLEAPVERVELIGNSVQPTTTGKNLFDESKAVTGRINPDNGELLPETSYISSDYIEVQEGETYFQSGSGDGYYRAFYDMNKKFTSIPTKGIFKITVPVGSKFLRISGRKERFGDWMIEKGDKATPYEPYTGLKSSPSPEYPQEIKSAGRKSKNLFDINYFKDKSNLKMLQCEGFTLLGIICNVKPNTEYTLSANLTEAKYNLNIANKTKRFSLTSAPSRTLTSNDDGTLYIGLFNTTADLINMDDFMQQYKNIQLEEGNKTDYEPYSDKYLLNVKVNGKNLFDREKARDINNWTDSIVQPGYIDFSIYVGKGNSVNISYSENLEAGLGFYAGIAQSVNNGPLYWLYHSLQQSLNKNNYKLIAECDYISVRVIKSNLQGFLEHIKTLQIENSNTPTSYEPYTEQTVTLTSDRLITKWDKLVEQGGQIGWLYGSAVKTFESDVFKLYADNDKAIQYQVPFEEITNSWNELVCYCNTFENVIGQTIYTQSGKTDFYMGCVHKSMVFSAKNKQGIFQSIEAFQEWIRNSGTYVWYKTDNKKFVPLLESEQTQLRNLHSYNGTTNIMVDSGEVECGIKLTYRKEI